VKWKYQQQENKEKDRKTAGEEKMRKAFLGKHWQTWRPFGHDASERVHFTIVFSTKSNVIVKESAHYVW